MPPLPDAITRLPTRYQTPLSQLCEIVGAYHITRITALFEYVTRERNVHPVSVRLGYPTNFSRALRGEILGNRGDVVIGSLSGGSHTHNPDRRSLPALVRLVIPQGGAA